MEAAEKLVDDLLKLSEGVDGELRTMIRRTAPEKTMTEDTNGVSYFISVSKDTLSL